LTQQRKTRIGDTSEAGVYLNHLAPLAQTWHAMLRLYCQDL